MDPDRDRVRLDPELLRIDPGAFVAFNAFVVGDVHVGAGASIWFGTVVRGDTERIRIGARTNLQDGTVVHADPGFPCLLGEGVTVGHRCVVHGAIVGDGALIGMSATLMNGVEIGPETLVGAGALLTEDKKIPPRSLVLGAPARVIRTLTDEEVARLRASASRYVELARAYREAGLDSLPEMGPPRA
jgi:carbonic anhydrase/acetyltransferase-like protein (isoleucine patch superfamily)